MARSIERDHAVPLAFERRDEAPELGGATTPAVHEHDRRPFAPAVGSERLAQELPRDFVDRRGGGESHHQEGQTEDRINEIGNAVLRDVEHGGL